VAAAAAAGPTAVLLPPATLADARLLYATTGAPAHDYPGHAECAARVPAILEALQARGLTDRAGQVLELTGFAAAPRETIQLVHSEGYVAGLDRASAKCADSSTTLEVDFAPTYITSSTAADACLVSGRQKRTPINSIVCLAGSEPSNLCLTRPFGAPCGFRNLLPPASHLPACHGRESTALLYACSQPAPAPAQPFPCLASAQAAGAAVSLVDHVVAASRAAPAPAHTPAGFAVCRPPGHHCLPTTAMGFCIFGNAAIAARHAQRAHGLQRVLIYDWDVHHGNGTQAVFENDPDVLFISSHQGGK
jgi:acetoin utilization deacetylase AcuC-like enzyme